jgi:cellulose synthase/poly-beta-1,6-N-acetylglucosamine synthase-like glycosyltransferase
MRTVTLKWAGKAPSHTKRIALLIPQYNEGGKPDFRHRLSYFMLLAQKYEYLLDVILIDDGSTDDSLRWIADFYANERPVFHFVEVRPNMQKVGALYAVAAVLKHEYVVLSDFDTDLEDLENLDICMDTLDSGPQIMGCYFKMIPHEGAGVPYVLQRLEYSFARMYYTFHKREQTVPVMPGAGCCFKREMLLKVYSLHSGLRNGEDREATMLGLKLGFKTIYLNKVFALTRPPLTVKALIAQRKRWYLGYIETFYKERAFYFQMMAKGKRIGVRTLQDALGVSILLLLPGLIALLVLVDWKWTLYLLAAAFFFSISYYYSLILAYPEERREMRRKELRMAAVYPVFWLYVSFISWWKAVLAFRKKRAGRGENGVATESTNQGFTLLETVPEVNFVAPNQMFTGLKIARLSAERIAEPFIGQVEYLKYLAESEGALKNAHVLIELAHRAIDRLALEKAVSFFVRRHESLRTIFPLIDGQIRQVILPADKEFFGIRYVEQGEADHDLADLRKATYEQAGRALSDVRTGPLVKFIAIKERAGRTLFSILIHHVIYDVWSGKIIESELIAFYTAYLEGREPQIAPLPLQLKDYCERQNVYFADNKERIRSFWKNKLRGFDELFEVKSYYRSYGDRYNDPQYIEKAVKIDTPKVLLEILDRTDGAALSIRIGNARLSQIRKLAQRNGCSVSAVLYASFYLFIFRYTGKKKILLASLVADRKMPESRGLIGSLLGGCYLPRKLSESFSVDTLLRETFHDLMESVQNIIYSHKLLGIDEQELRMRCELYINYTFSIGQLRSGEQSWKEHEDSFDVYYPIYAIVREYSNDLSICWRYNTVLYTKELIEDMAACHEEIIDNLTIGEKLLI